jgi:hypothetical protein
MGGKKGKKLYAGVGAKGTVLLRFVTPKMTDDNEAERMTVVLIGEQKQTIQGGKERTLYTFRREDAGDEQPLLSATARYVKIVEEGNPRMYFDPKALEKKIRDAESFKEPRIKWKKSKGKRLLYEDLMDGVVPLIDDPNMDAEQIFFMHDEYGEYDPDKFASRLKTLRDAIRVANTRADDDLEALETYKELHKDKVSLFSHYGYSEFQGSEAQRLLQRDIADGLHQSMGKKELYTSRPEYFNEYPLNVFRDRIYQELRTAKYLHTCKVKGKLHKSS